MFIIKQQQRVVYQFAHGKKAWFKRHINDIYVKKANESNYRSRASFKLIQILQNHPSVIFNDFNKSPEKKLKNDSIQNNKTNRQNNSQGSLQKQLNKNQVEKILDLGSSPGSWSQVLKQLLPNAHIASVDLLQMKPIQGVDFFMGDARSKTLHEKLINRFDRFQLIVSDMAPNFSGDLGQTHHQILQLNSLCVQLCYILGSPSCSLIMKSVQGQQSKNFFNFLSILFCNVFRQKPSSSRSQSVEFFYVCEKLKQLNRQKHQIIELLGKIMQNIKQQLQPFKNKKEGIKYINQILNQQ